MENEEMRLKIKRIQIELSVKTTKMAEFLNMNLQTYRNCLSAHNPTNNFKDVTFEALKQKL